MTTATAEKVLPPGMTQEQSGILERMHEDLVASMGVGRVLGATWANEADGDLLNRMDRMTAERKFDIQTNDDPGDALAEELGLTPDDMWGEMLAEGSPKSGPFVEGFIKGVWDAIQGARDAWSKANATANA